MTVSKSVLCTFFASVLGLVPIVLGPEGRAGRSARRIAEVTPGHLPGSKKGSRITAFDVAPDGREIGVLYTTWPSRTTQELRVAIWDVRSRSFSEHALIGFGGLLAPSSPLIDDEVIFTRNGKYLVVLGLGKIWILNADTCAKVRSMRSPRPDLGPPTDVLRVGLSSFAAIYKWGRDRFYVSVLNASGGETLASWPSSALPQSFSPDGKVAVGPDGKYNKGGVTDLELMSARTGAEIKTIPVRFGFKRRDSELRGSVTALFLDDRHIVVTPDNSVDSSGHHSGNSLEVINIGADRGARLITPKDFGPTGELAVSPDYTHFVVYSSFASAWAERWDGLWPNFHKPKLLLYESRGSEPELTIPLSSRDGAVAHLRNLVLPRLSSMGAVVAVAQRGAVEVFGAGEQEQGQGVRSPEGVGWRRGKRR